MTKLLNIISNQIPFTVRIVETGDVYGLNDCLTHDKEESMVEFYDQRYSHTPYGQFINRYNMDTILKTESGIDLYTSEPTWKVNKEQIQEVKDWLITPKKKIKFI